MINYKNSNKYFCYENYETITLSYREKIRYKNVYDHNGNETYYEGNEFWEKREYLNGLRVYYENSYGDVLNIKEIYESL